jgi:hypothetical protein
MGVELMLDPRGLFAARRHPVAGRCVGRAVARRGDGVGAAANPGARASGSARPTGVVSSAEESGGGEVRGSSTSSTRRWRGHSGESGGAGVELMLDPRELFAARRHPVARMCVGRAPARCGDGVGAAANPGARASGSARPTEVVSSAEESGGGEVRGSSTSSTRRWRGHSGESGGAGVGQCPTYIDSCRRPVAADSHAKALRSSESPLRTQLFAVPTGTPIDAATSECEHPWPYASIKAWR